MKPEQFDALRDWITQRTALLDQLRKHPDGQRGSNIRLDLADCDDEAKAVLVEEDEQ